jgi:putative copper export protein
VSTGYGRAPVAKPALLGLVAALGAYNHHRLVPAVVDEDDAVAWRLLGHTAAVEAVTIGVGVLVATAAMTSGGL